MEYEMEQEELNKESLVVIWSSRDIDVAKELAFPYAYNSQMNQWWYEVTFVVWGPSVLTLCESKDLQTKIEDMLDAGLTVEACKACTDNYGKTEELEKMGIKIKYMGVPLTNYLKDGRKVLTF
jgi:hypothetical protein